MRERKKENRLIYTDINEALWFFKKKCFREHYWKNSSFLVIVLAEKWTFCRSSFIKYMCMSRTLVNMLKCPGTQMKVEELGHLWLRMLHGAFEAFVQPGSKWLRRQPSQWIINTKAKLGFHAASCVIVEIIWSCVIWFDWHPVRRTQTGEARNQTYMHLSSSSVLLFWTEDVLC